jgi:hypothetical protein
MKLSESTKKTIIASLTGAVVSAVVDRMANKVIASVTDKVNKMIDDYRNNRDNRIKVKEK